MHHQRNAHRFKAASNKFRTVCGRRGGQGVAMHVGKVDSRLLEDAAIAQNAGAPAAAGLTLPVIFKEVAAVDSGELLADRVLQLEEKGFNGICVRFAHQRFFECAL